MDEPDLLKHVVGVLDSLGIAYMVVGSYASGAWGEPRFTYDIDLVVSLSPADVRRLVTAFPSADFYLSEDAVRQAVASGGQFNLIHPESGHKVDFMIEGANEWARQQLARRRLVTLPGGLATYVGAPEDIILSKMLYYQEGGSEKHLRDITGILKVSPDDVDRAYVARWAAELGVTDIWEAILRRLAQR
jgi:predicted nucleotidyltransferase